MAKIVRTSSEVYSLTLDKMEAKLLNDVMLPNDVQIQLEQHVTDWIKVKHRDELNKRNRNWLNKLLSADSSTQQAVRDLLFGTT